MVHAKEMEHIKSLVPNAVAAEKECVKRVMERGKIKLS